MQATGQEGVAAVQHIVVVGGGYAGFYTAWGLEKRLRRGEARVTVIDPRPYMTYRPFLPEVASGSVEARHATVPLRRHLRRTRVVAGAVTRIDHAARTVTVAPRDGRPFDLAYDVVVVTAGAVTRTLPIPGLVDTAIGLKQVEEAVAVRDHVLTAFDRAAVLPPGPERRRLLTFTFVGGGFSGVEAFGETLSLATSLLASYPELGPDDLAFHLVEARDRILPEVTDGPGAWVVRHLRRRGARVHLGAQLRSAVDGHVVLSTGEEFDSGLVVWTAGNAANPVVSRHTDLPVTARGLVRVRADLRVVDADGAVVPDAWAGGARGADRPERAARRPAGPAARPEPRGDAARPPPAGLRAPLPRRRRHAGPAPGGVPVPPAGADRPAGVAGPPRLPRAGRADLGAQAPRPAGLARRGARGPGHRLARRRRRPAARVRLRRRRPVRDPARRRVGGLARGGPCHHRRSVTGDGEDTGT
jgi:NADH dehydrogenase